MISVQIPSLGTLPTFNTPETQENYWQERLAYEYSLLLYNMSQAGYVVRQVEESDVSTQLSDLNAAIQSAYTEINALYGGGDV